MAASWTVVQNGKVLAHQEGEEFAPEFSKALEPCIADIMAKKDVRGVLTVNSDGATILVLTGV